MESREEIDEETMKRVKVQLSVRLSQHILDQLDKIKELRSVYSRNLLIEKILEGVMPRINEKYMTDRQISLDGLKIFL